EVAAIREFLPHQKALSEMMEKKVELEAAYSAIRLDLQRIRQGYGPNSGRDPNILEQELATVRERVVELDQEIAPLARASAQLLNPNWGLLTRTGNDKSHLARQIERYADI